MYHTQFIFGNTIELSFFSFLVSKVNFLYCVFSFLFSASRMKIQNSNFYFLWTQKPTKHMVEKAYGHEPSIAYMMSRKFVGALIAVPNDNKLICLRVFKIPLNMGIGIQVTFLQTNPIITDIPFDDAFLHDYLLNLDQTLLILKTVFGWETYFLFVFVPAGVEIHMTTRPKVDLQKAFDLIMERAFPKSKIIRMLDPDNDLIIEIQIKK